MSVPPCFPHATSGRGRRCVEAPPRQGEVRCIHGVVVDVGRETRFRDGIRVGVRGDAAAVCFDPEEAYAAALGPLRRFACDAEPVPGDRFHQKAARPPRRRAVVADASAPPGLVEQGKRGLAVAHDEDPIPPRVSCQHAFDGIEFRFLVARVRWERSPVRRDAVPRAPRGCAFPRLIGFPRLDVVLAAIHCVRVLDLVSLFDGKTEGYDHLRCVRIDVAAFPGLHADVGAAIRGASGLRLLHVAVSDAEAEGWAGEDGDASLRGQSVPVVNSCVPRLFLRTFGRPAFRVLLAPLGGSVKGP